MAKIQVGIIVYRDETGNFLPKTRPIYRDIDRTNQPRPKGGLCLGKIPLSRVAECEAYEMFAEKYEKYLRAKRERLRAQRTGGGT